MRGYPLLETIDLRSPGLPQHLQHKHAVMRSLSHDVHMMSRTSHVYWLFSCCTESAAAQPSRLSPATTLHILVLAAPGPPCILEHRGGKKALL